MVIQQFVINTNQFHFDVNTKKTYAYVLRELN